MTVLDTPFGKWRFEGDLGLETQITLENNREVSFQHIIKQTNGDALDWVEEYERERLAKYAEGQARDSHGRFASGGVSPAFSQDKPYFAANGQGYPDSPIKLTKIGTKELPTGWDYIPASKAPKQLADRLYPTQAGYNSVANIYYKQMADQNQLEVYKHSSGLWLTVEGNQVNVSNDVKMRMLQDAAEVYKANKGLITGNLTVRFDNNRAYSNRYGAAGDYRHDGARPFYSFKPMALASKPNKVIQIHEYSKETLVHEFGHIISFSVETSKGSFTADDRGRSYKSVISRRPRPYVSEYAMNNTDEWYAETFTQWTMGGGQISRQPWMTDQDHKILTNFAQDQQWKMPK